jgi:hypothetical protein
MWLDAFNLKKSRDIENIVVPLVPLVPPAGNPMNMRALPEPNGTVDKNHFGSTGSAPALPEPVEPNTKNGLLQFGSSGTQYSREFPACGTNGTSGTNKKQEVRELTEKSVKTALEPFQFDKVQADMDAGYPSEDLYRVNNMTWEFMQSNNMPFDEAIKRAAAIVADEQMVACEAAYIDVMRLFKRLNK